MDALTPESSSHVFKSKRVIAANWRPTRQPVFAATTMVLAGLMMTAGCKTGNPLEHAVRVTHQPGGSHIAETPRTRLTAQGKSEPSDAAVQGELEQEHDQIASAEPVVTSMKTSAQSGPGNGKNSPGDATQAALDGEYEELMSAFQDSPPEVQQQARRQLLAVSLARRLARNHPQASTER